MTDEELATVDAEYDVAVVGGGPGGLTTALYTSRLTHDTALIDRGGGRAAMISDMHNVIGVPDSVSGKEFLQTATEQVEAAGGDLIRERVESITPADGGNRQFELSTSNGILAADIVVLATGFTDERPEPPLPRPGRGLHYCLYCDGPLFVDEPVYVMGHSESAAYVAMIMLNFTDDVDLLLRGARPSWSKETGKLLEAHPVSIVEAEIDQMIRDDDDPTWLGGFEFEDGTRRQYRGGFAMYGATYANDLARELGCELTDDGAVVVDETGQTTVDGVYAVGDLTPGPSQVPVAMGEGSRAGIAINKTLRTYPQSLEELSGVSLAEPRPSTD